MKTASKQRVIGRPFPKGVSGNPAGRSSQVQTAANAAMEALAKAATPKLYAAIAMMIAKRAAAGDPVGAGRFSEPANLAGTFPLARAVIRPILIELVRAACHHPRRSTRSSRNVERAAHRIVRHTSAG